jgi:hypothetical protein
LGLDNIGIFDRSALLPTSGHINQSDGTAWMAMYTLNLMRIALALAEDNHVYEDVATKFFEHFLYIAKAMTNIGGRGIGLWDEEDEFYYDLLHLPGGKREPLRVRSMVGAQSCARIARTKVKVAGEKRRPDIDANDTTRTTSGSVIGWVRTPGMVGENSGKKQTPKPAATIIWIQSSRSLWKPTRVASPCSRRRSAR